MFDPNASPDAPLTQAERNYLDSVMNFDRSTIAPMTEKEQIAMANDMVSEEREEATDDGFRVVRRRRIFIDHDGNRVTFRRVNRYIPTGNAVGRPKGTAKPKTLSQILESSQSLD